MAENWIELHEIGSQIGSDFRPSKSFTNISFSCVFRLFSCWFPALRKNFPN